MSSGAGCPQGDTGITLTRERWLLILFQELGYGRLSFQGKLAASGVDYPISHCWEQVPIHLVSFRQDLDRRDPAGQTQPAQPDAGVSQPRPR